MRSIISALILAIILFVAGCTIKHARPVQIPFYYNPPSASNGVKRSSLFLAGQRFLLAKPIDKRKTLKGEEIGTTQSGVHKFQLITESGDTVIQIIQAAIRRLLESKGFKVLVVETDVIHKNQRAKSPYLLEVDINDFEIKQHHGAITLVLPILSLMLMQNST